MVRKKFKGKDYLSGPPLVTRALNKQSFLWLVAEEEFREMKV